MRGEYERELIVAGEVVHEEGDHQVQRHEHYYERFNILQVNPFVDSGRGWLLVQAAQAVQMGRAAAVGGSESSAAAAAV